MGEMYLIKEETLTSLADTIRAKTGVTGALTLEEMTAEAESIVTPVDGSIDSKTASDLTVSGATVSVPAGYYASDVSKSVGTATQATPSIAVSSSGLITASATQTAGYVSAGTKSATKQLTTKAATTWTPTTSNQTIASGTYLTGTQTIKGDSNLKAENIKSGVSIFGVAGSLTAGSSEYTITHIKQNDATSLTFALPAKRTNCVVLGNLYYHVYQYSDYSWHAYYYSTGYKFIEESGNNDTHYLDNTVGSIVRNSNDVTINVGDSQFTYIYDDNYGYSYNGVDLWVIDYD